MFGLIIRRLLVGVIIVLVVSVVVFGATLALPGDPARAILGQQATPERIAALQASMRLDLPACERYLRWVGGLFMGDLGTSTATGGSVNSLLASKIGNTAVLMLAAAVIATPVALLAGTYSAIRRGRTVDHVLTWISLTVAALPEFVVGIILIIVFSTTVFTILPSVVIPTPGEPAFAGTSQMVLPVLTLVIAVVPYVIRMMRATMIDVLDSGHVEMARLKGMNERTVILRHAMPHAIGPVVQVLALQLAWLAGGVVVIEFLFRYPGIGQAMIDAVGNRDVQVVQAITLIIAAFYILVNLLADIIGILVDPKQRTDWASR